MSQKLLLKDVPTHCSQCGVRIFTGPPRPKISKLALLLGFVGIGITALWVFLFLSFSPVYVSQIQKANEYSQSCFVLS